MYAAIVTLLILNTPSSWAAPKKGSAPAAPTPAASAPAPKDPICPTVPITQFGAFLDANLTRRSVLFGRTDKGAPPPLLPAGASVIEDGECSWTVKPATLDRKIKSRSIAIQKVSAEALASPGRMSLNLFVLPTGTCVMRAEERVLQYEQRWESDFGATATVSFELDDPLFTKLECKITTPRKLQSLADACANLAHSPGLVRAYDAFSLASQANNRLTHLPGIVENPEGCSTPREVRRAPPHSESESGATVTGAP